MAGFDFYMPYRDSELRLLRSLLAKAQRICRVYNLEMRYRNETDKQRYYVGVDGPLVGMQASFAVLARTLPAFAEGACDPVDRRARIRLATRVVKRYWRGVVGITSFVSDTSKMLGGSPNSLLFDTDDHSEQMSERMWSLSKALVGYENGDIGPPQMVEEIHTSLEWVMQSAIGDAAKNLNYADMAERLRDSSIISASYAQEIIKMKDLRVGAKHKLKHVTRDECNEILHSCVEAIHYLLRAVQTD